MVSIYYVLVCICVYSVGILHIFKSNGPISYLQVYRNSNSLSSYIFIACGWSCPSVTALYAQS